LGFTKLLTPSIPQTNHLFTLESNAMFHRFRISRSTRDVATLVTTLALASFTLVLGACESTKSGGRIDPYKTTESDRQSGKASIPSMLEFSDQVGESLAQEIGEIDEIQGLKEKVVLELGSIL